MCVSMITIFILVLSIAACGYFEVYFNFMIQSIDLFSKQSYTFDRSLTALRRKNWISGFLLSIHIQQMLSMQQYSTIIRCRLSTERPYIDWNKIEHTREGIVIG